MEICVCGGGGGLKSHSRLCNIFPKDHCAIFVRYKTHQMRLRKSSYFHIFSHMLEIYIFFPFEELKIYHQIFKLAQRNLYKNVNIEQNVYRFSSLHLQAES